MIELVKRMGLYDILAMLIPGYLIYLLVGGHLIGSSKLAYLSDFERTLLLVVYLLLTLKVHSMIWEGDAYYKGV